jgi:uncharacterized repeat protein (TIGR01451 family)
MEKRPSRQDFIVPPKGVSVTSMVIGVALCGLAGFAVVWLAGLGRTVPAIQSPIPSAATNSSVSSPQKEELPVLVVQPAEEVQQSRFSSVGSQTYQESGRIDDYPARPASFEKTIEKNASFDKATDEERAGKDTADTESSELSRFSAKQISPPTLEAVDEQPVAKESSDAPVEGDQDDSLAGVIAKPIPTPPLHNNMSADTKKLIPPVSQQESSPNKDVLADDALADDALADQVTQDMFTKPDEVASKATTSAVIDVQDEARHESLETPEPMSKKASQSDALQELSSKHLAEELTGNKDAKNKEKTSLSFAKPAPEIIREKQSESKKESLVGQDNPGPDRLQAEPLAKATKAPMPQAPGVVANEAPSPPQPLASTKNASPLSANSNPFAVTNRSTETPPLHPKKPLLQNTGVAMPFAAAPPLGTPQDLATNLKVDQDAKPIDKKPAAVPAVSGQGRPGVPQLEGLQTPQLTLEKSGPRDLQVGKPARFEVIVRNVGSATAHDTVLRDAIPFGTSLITTMPPASPGATNAPSGELLWSIGELRAGQEARVAMEVMPELEGDVGSVASVTFRADATVRSRVTKPALEISAEPLLPTLIGEMMAVDITLTNPGTGTATGVIVEGILPDSVSHPAGREVEFDVGQLEPGSSQSISLKLATITPGVHEIRIGARADGGIEISRPLRAEITAPMMELHADIPNRRYLQRPATCTLKMHNTGTAPALAVELAAQLPAGMKFVRANNAGYYDDRTHRVLWSLEELPAGEVGTVEFVAMPTVLGPQAIVAAVRNPAGLADQLSHSIEVEGLASLALEVADSEDPIEINGLTEYIVQVANQGTKAATNVALSAKLLGDLEPVKASGPVPYEVQNLMITFEPLASLAPADEAVFHVQVRGRRPGNQRVQFQLQSDDLQSPLTSEEMTHVYADR